MCLVMQCGCAVHEVLTSGISKWSSMQQRKEQRQSSASSIRDSSMSSSRTFTSRHAFSDRLGTCWVHDKLQEGTCCHQNCSWPHISRPTVSIRRTCCTNVFEKAAVAAAVACCAQL